MGRRSDHKRPELKEVILRAAEAIVRDAGPDGLTARRLADRVGYSPGTLYNIFVDLNDIVLHVNARTLDRLAGRYQRITGLSTAEEWLAAYARIYVRFTRQDRELWRLVLANPSARRPPGWYRRRVRGMLTMIEKALDPLFPSGDPGQSLKSARVLWASLHGITNLTEGNSVDAAPGDLVNDLITRYVAGLRRGG